MNKWVALQRLALMGDWLRLKDFRWALLIKELGAFEKDWKPYNPRKGISRMGLSVTSLDGGLNGVPDLDSLSEYNSENGTQYNNQSFLKVTPVLEHSTVLKEILAPYREWLGRCHFIRLDAGGFFPEHYDCMKFGEEEEIRLIGFVQNCEINVFKFCYEDRLIAGLANGQLYYFNASKRHSVFSLSHGVIFLVITLRFDLELFKTVLKNYQLT